VARPTPPRFFFLPFLLMVLAAAPAAARDADREAARLQALRDRLDTLQAEQARTRDLRDSEREALNKLDRELRTQQQALRETNARLRAQQKKLNALERERQREQARLGSEREQLAAMVRAAWLMERDGQVKWLLSEPEPARLARLMGYQRAIGTWRATRIASSQKAIDSLRAIETRISGETRELENLRNTEKARSTALDRTRRERQSLLAGLDRKLAGQSRTLEQLRQDERSLAALVQRLKRTVAATPVAPVPATAPLRFGSFKAGRGRLPAPVEGKLFARFGQAKPVGGLHWQGVFVAVEEGSAVRAVYRGRVVYADWLRGFGLLVIVDHGQGFMTLYGHNRSATHAVGDWVEGGQPIAESGSSGGPPLPGVYFEVRSQGEPRDPHEWCKL
jgi:septal ring factor EnvC (AmiA/AmiB activator)